MADGSITIDTALNNQGFIKGIRSMNDEMSGLSGTVKKLGALIAAAFSVRAIINFSKECLEFGSAIAEVQNVVDVAFGDMSYKIEQFADTAIQNFGMSRLSAKKTASTYMAMAKGMGIADEAASDMAISLTGLTGDVASFFNISQDLADTKLKSVFTGETETLKDLGVVMTQTNLKAFALEKGINKDISAMSQAELVALRYEFVMDQLSLAQGDFVRTSGNWANQTRILSEQWKEFMSVVGDSLIKVLTPLLRMLNEIVMSLIDAANAVNTIITALFGGASAQMEQTKANADDASGAIKGSVETQNNLTDAVKKTNKEAQKSLATFDEIYKLTGDTKIETTAPDQTGGSIGVENIEDAEEKVEGVSERMKILVENIKSALEELKKWLSDFWTPFAEGWSEKGGAVITAIKTAFSDILEMIQSIGGAFMNVWANNTGAEILTTILGIIQSIFDIAGVLAERFRIAWEANRNGEAIWQALLNIIQSVLNFVDRLAVATLNWAQGLDLEPIVSSFRRLLEAVDPLVSLILDGLAWCYENVLLPLASWVIEEAAPVVVNLLAAALGALTPIIEALKPFALWLWENFLKPLGQWTGEIIIAALKGITEALLRFSDWARENQETIEGAVIAISALLATIVSYYVAQKIPAIIEAINTAFKSLASGIGAVQPKALLTAVALAAVVVAVIEVAKCWDQMTGVQKVVAALGAVIAVAFAAALAVGAFQSALSMGVAIAAIVAGITAMTIAVAAAKSQAESISKSVSTGNSGNLSGISSLYGASALSIPALATGAVIPPNREFLAVLGDQKSGTNIEAPTSEIEAAVARGIRRAGGAGGGSHTVILEVDKQVWGRVTYQANQEETQRVGVDLVE